MISRLSAFNFTRLVSIFSRVGGDENVYLNFNSFVASNAKIRINKIRTAFFFCIYSPPFIFQSTKGGKGARADYDSNRNSKLEKKK